MSLEKQKGTQILNVNKMCMDARYHPLNHLRKIGTQEKRYTQDE